MGIGLLGSRHIPLHCSDSRQNGTKGLFCRTFLAGHGEGEVVFIFPSVGCIIRVANRGVSCSIKRGSS